MIVNPIKDGVVLDHITAGKAMEIYSALNLENLDCQVAIILNAISMKMGRKDILKICEPINVDLDVLGYIDPGITVNIIRDGEVVEQKHLELPEKLTNILKCSNPRCITSTEQELPHIFKLTNRAKCEYKCLYCESKYKNSGDL